MRKDRSVRSPGVHLTSFCCSFVDEWHGRIFKGAHIRFVFFKRSTNMADSDDDLWTRAMNAESRSPTRPPKRPAEPALDESDGEGGEGADDVTSTTTTSTMPPVPRLPANGNQAVLVRTAAQRKKLRPEQLTDVELFTLVGQFHNSRSSTNIIVHRTRSLCAIRNCTLIK